MACFAVPTALGIATTAFRKKIPGEWHVGWLNTMVWGGAAALAVEHVAHWELVPWPPFLTAMTNPQDAAVMFHEMAAVGIPMTAALVLVWAAAVLVYENLVAPKKNETRAGA